MHALASSPFCMMKCMGATTCENVVGRLTETCPCMSGSVALQLFSRKSRTTTVPKVFQIALCGVAKADLELLSNSCGARFLGKRLYQTQFRPSDEYSRVPGLDLSGASQSSKVHYFLVLCERASVSAPKIS